MLLSNFTILNNSAFVHYFFKIILRIEITISKPMNITKDFYLSIA